MKIEFIIDKKEYQKLLTEDVKNSVIEYNSKKIKGKTNYILTLLIDNNNIASAKILSENRSELEKIFNDNKVKYRLLTEEASQLFVNKLYPLACKFETQLRKFIYITLFDVDEKAEKLILKNYNATMGVNKGQKIEKLPASDFLEKKELHEIFDFLFANDDFLSQVKDLVETKNTDKRHKTKKEVLEELNNINDKSLWQVIFKPVFSDCILDEIYKDVQKYRNSIMHFHNISYKEYKTMWDIFKRVIKDLDCQINKGIVIEGTVNNVNSLASSNTYAKSLFNELQIANSLMFGSLVQSSLGYKSWLDSVTSQIFPWQQQLENLQLQLEPWQQQLENLQLQLEPWQQNWTDFQLKLVPLQKKWEDLQLTFDPLQKKWEDLQLQIKPLQENFPMSIVDTIEEKPTLQKKSEFVFKKNDKKED